MTSPTLTTVSLRAGHLVRQQSGPEGYSAFIPNPLPPDPPVDFRGELRDFLEEASYALGRLEGVSTSLHPDRLLYMYIRKEAVLSSQIEGMQSTLSDLLQYENVEAPGVPIDDIREVSSYVNALQYGFQRLNEGMPLTLRLIREIHAVLMQSGGRGAHQTPGEFRRTQNWIGGTRPSNARFVPPPPHELLRTIGELEHFIHDIDYRTSPIVKAGLVHVQFETIHPFLDGNGRLGRLLITFLLCAQGALSQPCLYLSLYFKEHRTDYYDALQRVRSHGDWEGWMRYYLIGVAHTATQATRTTQALLALFATDRDQVLQLGRSVASALRVYEYIQQRVIVSIPRASETLQLSVPTVTAALGRLVGLGIAREITGKAYARQYVYQCQLDLLNQGGDERHILPAQ
jgi:Fic family protein